MTGLDAAGPIPGYYPSAWPGECGGPRRQKAPRSPGLGLKPGERLGSVSRNTGEWNVMMVQRAPGELFLQGNNLLGSPEAYGFVERIDPETLAPLARTPNLPAGGHTWCGGILAHANGYLYFNNGRYCYKLDRDCQVLARRERPQDAPYNSLLAMANGNLVMQAIRHEVSQRSQFVVLGPERLGPVGPELAIPEASMGRIAGDRGPDGEFVYVPGSHTLFRLRYQAGRLELDESWRPRYRTLPDDEQQFAWDSCLAGGSAWLMDNGDNLANVAIFATVPAGQSLPARGSVWHGLASGPLPLVRVGLADPTDLDRLTPFGAPRGSIISPPVYVPSRRIAVAFDSGNGRLGALRYAGPGAFEKLWDKPYRTAMQPLVFPDTGELVVNDFRQGRDHLAVIELESGAELGRAATESETANGMFLSAGFGRDIHYCSIRHIARVFVE